MRLLHFKLKNNSLKQF